MALEITALGVIVKVAQAALKLNEIGFSKVKQARMVTLASILAIQ